MPVLNSNTTDDAQLLLNGVDALTGRPLWDPQPLERIVQLATSEFERTSPAERELSKSLSEIKSQDHFGMDVDNLADPMTARWGVVIPAGADSGLRQALQPLIRHRANQLGVPPNTIPVFEVEPDLQAVDFLRRNGVQRGIGVVEKVPYYLLIAGDPRDIPFRFQMELNTEYATGRVHFDSRDGYAAYAERLVLYEQAAAIPNRREAAFWAPENEADPATSKSAPQLIRPLFEEISPKLNYAKRLFYGDVEKDGIEPASKANLHSIFCGPEPPALLFTASHGMGYRAPHQLQTEQQGALMTQEYQWGLPAHRDMWYGAEDLRNSEGDVTGLVHLAFACFSAGTPRYDDYASPDKPPPVIADQPFIAALPQQMLTRGALAFVGHVDRAWGYSFLAPPSSHPADGITPREAFQRAVARILRGTPVAHALRDEYDRGVHLSSSLLETISEMRRRIPVAPATLARLWTERNDARAYVVIGDPAARVRADILGKNPARISVPGTALPKTPPSTPAEVGNAQPQSAAANAPSQAKSGTSGTASSPQNADSGGRDADFLPLVTTGKDAAVDQELMEAWKNYIKEGFANNKTMFRRVLGAFLIPYWLTVLMYFALFLFGLGAFGLMLFLGTQQRIEFAAAFGGLSVAAFLTFFISKPLRALEQNILFITSLGVVYNTYWNQLMNANDPVTVRSDLETITKTAINDLQALAARQDKSAGKSPELSHEHLKQGNGKNPQGNASNQIR